MLKIFGKNNNQLFRHSQKSTYSMPQSLPFNEAVLTCACGFDYMAIITTQYRLYFLFQSKFYLIENVPLLIDIATSENTITMVSKDNQILVWDFDEDKTMKRSINYTRLKFGLEAQDKIKKVEMGGDDIFLLSQSGKVYHFKRNNWYETKSYSNIQSVELSHKIIDISTGPLNNLFLSYEGLIFISSKEDPLLLFPLKTKHTFIKVATNFYSTGITKKGTIMIWGNSIHGNYEEPIQFTKLTKKFIDIKLDKENGYALADDGQVWVWGVNKNGQLGLSDYETRIKPFPLITLQKTRTLEVFCGHSYACCLCQPQQKVGNNTIKIVDKKVAEFSVINPFDRSNKRKGERIEEYQYLGNQRNYLTAPFSEKEYYPIPISTKSSYPKKNLFQAKDQAKSHTGAKFPLNPTYSQNMPNGRIWTIGNEQSQENPKKYGGNLQMEVLQLREENERLKQKVSEQADIISDITEKIRLLEEAIDEYEKNLTSRDHVLQDFEAKQQQYICHIRELQRTIDEIVRVKEKNSQVLVVYEDLKSNFEKQREYYSEKMKDFENKLCFQQQKYKEEIERMRKRIQAKDAGNKENYSLKWQSQSPINKKPKQSPHFRADLQERRINNQSMDSVIDQIESNKSLITKSANKLIAMLDISQ